MSIRRAFLAFGRASVHRPRCVVLARMRAWFGPLPVHGSARVPPPVLATRKDLWTPKIRLKPGAPPPASVARLAFVLFAIVMIVGIIYAKVTLFGTPSSMVGIGVEQALCEGANAGDADRTYPRVVDAVQRDARRAPRDPYTLFLATHFTRDRDALHPIADALVHGELERAGEINVVASTHAGAAETPAIDPDHELWERLVTAVTERHRRRCR